MGRILNLTKKKVFAEDYLICKTLFEKALGLMFQTRMKRPLLFIFPKERRWSFHMFFVFFPIDIIFLDSKKRVVDLKKDFAPWSVYIPKKECSYVLELPVGTIKRSRTSIEDRVRIQ